MFYKKYKCIVRRFMAVTLACTAVLNAQTEDSTEVAEDSLGVSTLQKVEIVGRKQISYKNNESFGATKTAADLKDVPQSVSYVTKELMQDQMAVRTSDLVKNMSGVNQYSAYDDFVLRGFRVGGDRLLNGLRFSDGWSPPVVWNLERYEVIKGPASALYGNADPGGTINMVTKKPLNTPRQAVEFTTGSFNTYRSTMDFTGPLNKEESLLYRLNIGYENAESFRDLQLHKNLMIAPSISFLPDDRTRVNVDFVYSNSQGKLDRGQPIFGASAGTDLHSVPISFAIGKPNDFMTEKNLYVTASIHHQFSPWLSLNASYLKYKYNEDLMEHRTSNSYGVDGEGNEIPTLMGMRTIQRVGENVQDALATYAVTEFSLGQLKNQVTVGYDYSKDVTPEGRSANTSATGYRNASNTGTLNSYNPSNPGDYLLDNDGNPVPNVPHFDLEDPDYSLANVGDYILNSVNATSPSKLMAHGAYLQYMGTWGGLKGLVGLREEYYVDFFAFDTPEEEWVEQFAFIPRLGLVWAAVPDVNVYGTYSQGFQPHGSSTVQDPDLYGGPFDPLTSRLFEAGVKGDFFRRRLGTSLATYQITQNNILVDAGDPNNPDLLRQRGQERSRGAEIEAQGRITRSFSLNANASLSKTEITKDSDPELEGEEKPNAPNLQAGLWARYNLRTGSLRGFGFGAGTSYVGKRNTNSEELKLPAYAVVDAALYYSVSKFRLAFKVNNIFDETHWPGGYDYNRLFPGAPRHFLSSVAYTF